jgi:hypothetical protein
MDDLDLVEVVLQTEGVSDLDLPVESPDALLRGTAGDLWRMLTTRAGAGPAPGPPPAGDTRWLRVREALGRVMGVPPTEITPDRRLNAQG